ncbi:endonuclease [Vibrio ishigakensis]|uniref:Endonuclease n=1 Tax=Vibrio ishigakensis TaxID=1481914 RepID=A0A0B8Q8P5_9VIBR|nr:endonuclease [Vibrio ishigakensis]
MIRIASLNLFNYIQPPSAYYDFENIYSQKQWQDKQAWLTRTLFELNADVIGLQEVFSVEVLKQHLFSLGYGYFYAAGEPKLESDYVFSEPVVAIASRYPITDVETLAVDLRIRSEFSFSRAPLLATIVCPDLGELDCCVVHFKSQRPTAFDVDEELRAELAEVERWRSTSQRGMEARYLLHLLKKAKTDKGNPQILMGDFNRDLSSTELSCLIDSENHSLYDPKTFQHPMVLYPTHYYGETGSILDYILVSEELSPESAVKAIEVSNYQVIDKHLVSPVYDLDYMASDHALISIDLNPISAS